MVNVLPVPVAIATSIWRLRSAMACSIGGVGLDLVGPQPRVVVRRARRAGRRRRRSRGRAALARAAGVWKPATCARAVQLVADVVEPDHLAVGGVEERHAVAAEVEGFPGEPLA